MRRVVTIGLMLLSMVLFMSFARAQQSGFAGEAVPKLLDLGAGKCIPCKKMAPILEQMEKDFKGVLTVEFIDVWKPENRQVAVDLGIESIPTQIFYDGQGKELWRHVGFISREDLLAKWTQLGYSFSKGEERAEDASSAVKGSMTGEASEKSDKSGK